jgi:GrpB-like predicted nucleotidyltransferase (UPF0157 family)
MEHRIEIVPYRRNWVSDFIDLKRAILSAAPGGSYLHHIGSTAVPGLAAKDIIDLQLTVHTLDEVDPAAFAAAGFRAIGGVVDDHCPPGLSLAPDELNKRLFRSLGRAANLHVREKGRFNQRYALLCRDYLRAHPVTAGAYELIKLRLAERFPDDASAYYDIKDPVFDIIMDGADEWARSSGWTEPERD